MAAHYRMALFVFAAGWLGAAGLWAIDWHTGSEEAFQALLLEAANEPAARWILAGALIISGLIWVPSSVFTIAGAALFGWVALAIAWPSILVGAAVGYAAGRFVVGSKKEAETRHEIETLAPPAQTSRLDALLKMVHVHPAKATALIRLTPGIPFGAQCVTFGALATPFAGYMLGTSLPTLLVQALWTVLGVLSADALQRSYAIVQDFWQVGAAGTILAVGVVVFGVWRGRSRDGSPESA